MAHWTSLVFTGNTAYLPHIPLGVLYKKKKKKAWLFFSLPPHTLHVALGAEILFSAEQKEMSGIILINVSYLIFSVNKCFVYLITCTCEADFSSSCDLKELRRDCTVKRDYTYC